MSAFPIEIDHPNGWTELLQDIVAVSNNFGYLARPATGIAASDELNITQMDAIAAAAGKPLIFPSGRYKAGLTKSLTPTTSWLCSPNTVFALDANATHTLINYNATLKGIYVIGPILDGSAKTPDGVTEMCVIRGENNHFRGSIYDSPATGLTITQNALLCSADVHVERSWENGAKFLGCVLCHIDGTFNDVGKSGAGDGITFQGNATDCVAGQVEVYHPKTDGIAGYGADVVRPKIDNLVVENPGNNGCHLGGDGIIGKVSVTNAGNRGVVLGDDNAAASDGGQIGEIHVNGTINLDGVWVINVTGFSADLLDVKNAGSHGVNIEECEDFSIGTILSRSNANRGVEFDECSHGSVGNLTSVHNNDDGVNINTNCVEISIGTSVVTDNVGNGYASTAGCTNLSIGSGVVARNTAGNFSISSSITNRIYQQVTDTSNLIASAAVLTLPLGLRNFRISGTVNITSIASNGFVDQIIVLTFNTAGCVVTSSDTLRLHGDFTSVTGGYSTLTLAHNQSRWVEVARNNA
jgi:hypothetical protein